MSPHVHAEHKINASFFQINQVMKIIKYNQFMHIAHDAWLGLSSQSLELRDKVGDKLVQDASHTQ